MDSLPASSSPVELCFTFPYGPVIREAGRSRPIALDAVARDHGQRAVDLMMEQPGQWIGIESAEPTPAPPSPPRLPIVHPGTPGQMRVGVILHIVRINGTGWLVEHPTDPRGQVWLSRKHTQIGTPCGKYGCEEFHIRVWLWWKIVGQL